MKHFLEKGDAGHLLTEYANSGTLKDTSRRTLVREMGNYLRTTYGNNAKITGTAYSALSLAAINLFPSFKVADSEFGGIVSQYIFNHFTKYICKFKKQF